VPELIRVVVGIGPFCGVVGFLTPMMVDRWASGDPGRAGCAYAVNVLGSLLGPLLAGFWLLPAVGERSALVLLVLPLFAMGVIGVIRPPLVAATATVAGRRSQILLAGVVVAALLVTLVTKGWDDVLPIKEVRRDHTATVVAAGEGTAKILAVNGRTVAYMTPVTKMMAHLPLASLGRPPRDALVIAFGIGTTFRSLFSWGIYTTAVELVPSVPAFFGFFHRNAAELLASPRARVVIDDGRRFLDRSTEQYDVIAIDPPPPAEAAGSSLLYSKEFYSSAKKRLRPDGIVQQWLPATELPILASVAGALRDSFPHVRAFLHQTPGESGVYFLASLRPVARISGAALASRMPPVAVVDFLEWGPESTAEKQFDWIVRREQSIESLVGLAPGVPALQDDRPVNEYYFLRRLRHS
jgi:spermidine synthase